MMQTELDVAKTMFGWANEYKSAQSGGTSIRYGEVTAINDDGTASVRLDDTGETVKVRTDTPLEVGSRVTIIMKNGQYVVYSVTAINGKLTAQGSQIQGFAEALGDVSSQVDGKIEAHYGTYAPTTGNEPAEGWDDSQKESHKGDLFFNTVTGWCYRWTGSAWEQITDNRISQALTAAQNAETAADGKMEVFTTTPTPPYQEGDIWVNSGSNDDIKVCVRSRSSGSYSASDWTLASSYTNDDTVNELIDTFQLEIETATVSKRLVSTSNPGTAYVGTTKWFVFKPTSNTNTPIIAYATIPLSNVFTKRAINTNMYVSDYEFTISWPSAFIQQGLDNSNLPLSVVSASPNYAQVGAFSYNRNSDALGPLLLWRPFLSELAMTVRLEIVAMYRTVI